MNAPNLGYGLGLRTKHYNHIFTHHPKVDWFEVISENFMDTAGKPIHNLMRMRENYPIVLHGVSMSIGTLDPLNSEYLQKLKQLISKINPSWISDHLCWTGVAHKNIHDLLPVPYTQEALDHIVSKIHKVQDYLGMNIALENPSTYLEFACSEMSEADFIKEMAIRSGCNLLLDVNNVYVTCYNHRLNPKEYIDALPLEQVIQIHLSGHSNRSTHIIDTHDNHVIDEVWRLYKYTLSKANRSINTMVEWDDNIPEFDVLYNELMIAKKAANDALNFLPLPDFAQSSSTQIHTPAMLSEALDTMQNDILTLNAPTPLWIKHKREFPASAQLEVYRNAYRWRLFDVVAEDLPALKHYLGESSFSKLIFEFIEHTTPTHFNIARYIEKLPAYIKHILKDEFAYELCELEVALTTVSDMDESAPLSDEYFRSLTPESLLITKFLPRHALKMLHFRYPVNQYYQAVMDEKAPKVPTTKESYLCIYRDDNTVWRLDLEDTEYHILSKLFEGNVLGEILNDHLDVDSHKLSNWFYRWKNNKLFRE